MKNFQTKRLFFRLLFSDNYKISLNKKKYTEMRKAVAIVSLSKNQMSFVLYGKKVPLHRFKKGIKKLNPKDIIILAAN